MTRGPLVGRRARWTRDDLYEQCSLHITLKTPSSVYEGGRPSVSTRRRYSSSVKWCARTTSPVTATSPGNGSTASSAELAAGVEETGFGMGRLLARAVVLFDRFYHFVVVGRQVDRGIGLRAS